MGNYSKLIGSLVGAAAGVAVSFGLPEELATPEIQGAIVIVLAGVFTYFFPANKPPAA